MLKKFLSILAVGIVILAARSVVFASDKKVSSSLSHYIMGVVYADLGDLDNAIKEYRKALLADDKVALIHLNLAISLIKQNAPAAAVEELKEIEKLAPDSIEPHAILAILYSSQDKVDLAVSEYETALLKASKISPRDIDIYKSLGVLYLKQNKLNEAQGIYRLILALSPQDPEAHFYLGNVYWELKQGSLFEQELKKALELNPDYAEALNFLGYAFVEQNRNLRQAEIMIRKALRLEPDNGAYIDSLGWLYFKKGRTREAKKLLEKAASLMEDPVIYDHLGDAYFKLKEIAKAKLNWQKSLGLSPKQESVKKKIEGLEKNAGSTKSD
ncbi:MAG: tetratricopeptide repeat protein [Candidatus Omnitrophota bacterium]